MARFRVLAMGPLARLTRPAAVLDWWDRSASWLISLVVHLALMILLALWTEHRLTSRQPAVLSVQFAAPTDEEPVLERSPIRINSTTSIGLSELVQVQDVPEIRLSELVMTELPQAVPQPTIGLQTTLDEMADLAPDAPQGGGLEGRSADARGKLVAQRGGTPESEAAVERGLNWLAAHQCSNGGWRFDLKNELCNGLCRHPGTEASTTAATALALLPFLGAGYTHQSGPHQETVRDGLYYLGSRMLIAEHGGDLREGTMYAQGLAAITLCEAYAMTGDRTLKPYCDAAIKFILYAQDKKGGGWRYVPGEPGDTTVFGWQLMALKSARLAEIEVPTVAFALANRFLDSVQTHDGAGYGYLTPKREPTTTAVGLLGRMYLGWPHRRPALRSGVEFLDKLGPSDDNMYFNYYGTLVMHHYGGAYWYRWNERMRELLIGAQARTGHEAGSWQFSGGHSETAGRLYNTAMAVMTLEAYYRYMPLYGEAAIEGY